MAYVRLKVCALLAVDMFLAPKQDAVVVFEAALGDVAEVRVWESPERGSCGTSHPAAEYIGYTQYHLPGLNWKPELLKNTEAMFAIFAARMAFSSFEIRSRLRYGVNALNNVL